MPRVTPNDRARPFSTRAGAHLRDPTRAMASACADRVALTGSDRSLRPTSSRPVRRTPCHVAQSPRLVERSARCALRARPPCSDRCSCIPKHLGLYQIARGSEIVRRSPVRHRLQSPAQTLHPRGRCVLYGASVLFARSERWFRDVCVWGVLIEGPVLYQLSNRNPTPSTGQGGGSRAGGPSDRNGGDSRATYARS